jgi:hypothetical protein
MNIQEIELLLGKYPKQWLAVHQGKIPASYL